MGAYREGLTPKQLEFCRKMARGSSQSDAYRAAYDTSNMKPSTVHSRASEMAKRDDIQARIGELNSLRDQAMAHGALADAEFVLSKLRTWAETATPQDSNKIRAAELLGKARGLFKEHIEITDPAANLTPAEMREQLKAKLRAYLAESSIDGQSRRLSPPDDEGAD